MIRQFQTQGEDEREEEIPTMRLLLLAASQSGKPPPQQGQEDSDNEEEDEDRLALDDSVTLASANIADNQVLHLVFCINEEEEEYEPVEVVSTDLPRIGASCSTAATGGGDTN